MNLVIFHAIITNQKESIFYKSFITNKLKQIKYVNPYFSFIYKDLRVFLNHNSPLKFKFHLAVINLVNKYIFEQFIPFYYVFRVTLK